MTAIAASERIIYGPMRNAHSELHGVGAADISMLTVFWPEQQGRGLVVLQQAPNQDLSEQHNSEVLTLVHGGYFGLPFRLWLSRGIHQSDILIKNTSTTHIKYSWKPL